MISFPLFYLLMRGKNDMLTISNKIEDYLQNDNLIEYWYPITESTTTIKFGFKDDESYITLCYKDDDGYLMSERRYIIPNRGCLRYIRFGLVPLRRTLAEKKYVISEIHDYIYEYDDYDFKPNNAKLVKEVIRKPNKNGEDEIKKLYKYRDDDLCEIRIVSPKNLNTTDTQLVTIDREKGLMYVNKYFLYERKDHRNIVTESSRILKSARTIWELSTPCGTVCTIEEYIPSINSENRYTHFNMTVTSELDEDIKYIINSETETIERISTEIVSHGGSRPRRLKCHKLYSVPRDMIEKMMMEE